MTRDKIRAIIEIPDRAWTHNQGPKAAVRKLARELLFSMNRVEELERFIGSETFKALVRGGERGPLR